ncbi:hypothetical protein GCM10010420_31080 [Streptomyces glaucosporus]|uniref:Secreted protein n=1 Tax=Streptomyces glaucosporus TaxID=284044 RepID=A0ABP5VHU7_9ACTN
MIVNLSGKSCTIASLILILFLSVIGCEESEEQGKREYAVPRTLCGVNVDSNTLESFLPPGKEIRLIHEETDSYRWKCSVSVDGKTVLEVKRERWEQGWSARRFATVHAYVEPENETPDRTYVYSDLGGVGVVRCPPPEHDQDLFIVAKTKENTGGQKAMKELLASYREEVLRSDPCSDT